MKLKFQYIAVIFYILLIKNAFSDQSYAFLFANNSSYNIYCEKHSDGSLDINNTEISTSNSSNNPQALWYSHKHIGNNTYSLSYGLSYSYANFECYYEEASGNVEAAYFQIDQSISNQAQQSLGNLGNDAGRVNNSYCVSVTANGDAMITFYNTQEAPYQCPTNQSTTVKPVN